ncbi:hypothetical protein EKM05_06475 [Flavobacterium sp. GSP27]|uniref:hypothetical protein n=1 Tax=unclassified Flavobacterium TaxID=196869 RepID=UPI000F81BAB0|nr:MULTISPECIES: hypothetical protein [unclassified Flavobacterium]RTY67633.1 hypothetical protein EKL95_09090 [Flavobacterium sp. LB2P53]RTY91442.1 hypothetical protein EKM01_06570 [Flavobacterium sp. RSP46]RTY94728.1 hypothetical protein EKL32_09625 [Flavobacterium sp. GSN2]RTZ09935.1 hypothetical protein EKM05_06475 [Flavobacterium sp. GSP27]
MPTSSAVKGIGSIKTMYNTKKSAISNNEGSDFLKMYMLEKERTRLRSEEILISRRLNIIQIRLNEIQEFYNGQSILLQNPDRTESYQTNKDEEKPNFKTMSIDY